MSSSVTCTKCGQTITIAGESAGATVACSACGASIAVPAAGGAYAGLPGPQRSGSKLPLILAGVAVVAVLVVVAVVAGKMLFGGGGVTKAVRYLPDDCEVLVSLNADSVFKSKLYQKLEKDEAAKIQKAFGNMEKEIGLKPTDISRITVGTNISKRQAVVIIELNKAIDPKDLMKKAAESMKMFVPKDQKMEWKEEQVGGVTLYVHPVEFRDEAYHFPDNKTFVVGMPKILRTILERKGPPAASSKTQTLVGQLKPSRALTAAFDIGDQVSKLPPIPLPGAAEALKSATAAAVHADVGADVQIAASLTFKEEDPAKKLQEEIDKGRAEFDKAEGAPAELRELLKNLKVSRSGKTISAEITITEALIDKAIKDPAGMGIPR